MLQTGVWKMMTGALYNFVFANLIWQFWLAKLPEHGFLATWSYLYGYTFYMFFNFFKSFNKYLFFSICHIF